MYQVVMLPYPMQRKYGNSALGCCKRKGPRWCNSVVCCCYCSVDVAEWCSIGTGCAGWKVWCGLLENT
jgi:hypothetical protein